MPRPTHPWLPTTVKGKFFYWTMMTDIYSRKRVANEMHASETSELAACLLVNGCLREGLAGSPLVLHLDDGAAIKGSTMLAAMQNLGVMSSFSRPRVSNDNAYAESLFRTAKYCALWPEKPFDTLAEARTWVQRFVQWYNEEHRHSVIKYVTPAQRHRGGAPAWLRDRSAVYEAARRRQPLRWSSGQIRNWMLSEVVWINPERPLNCGQKRRAA